MNKFETLQKRELLILVFSFIIPILILGMIFLREKPETNLLAEVVPQETERVFNVDIKAKSALVTELNTGKILYSLNRDEERPIASITKLMTVLIASDKFDKQEISRLQIRENHLNAFGDSGLIVGQTWGVKDLIDFTLITSSNDGAKALALSAFGEEESSFVAEMNSLSRKLGLTNTFFSNVSGLDINLDTEAGAISTASDVTKILNFIVKNKIDVFKSTVLNEKFIDIEGNIYDAKNTNKSITEIPGSLLSKTGYTDLAGGNLAVVADFGLNNPVSIVILGSTFEERELDIKKLYRETADYYASNLFEY